MGAIATSISQQIQKLSDRGMILDMEKAKIEEILLDIGYYRLGFYWNPFEKNRNHEFKDGTKFSDAVALYYLDVDLRNILLKCLNRIEINFRTKLVYYASNQYNNSTWFADKRVMRNDFVESFSKHYDTTFIDNNRPIKKHHQKYINDKYAPAWKTLEFFTFGTIFKIFRSLNDENLKLEISRKYGINHAKTFVNYINTIIFIRNTCAHGGVLFDLNTPTEIKMTSLINFRNYANKKHSLDSCIKVILYFLQTISNDRKSEIETQLDELFLKNSDNQIIKDIIETKMGYKKINT
jgi:abortive infection bacteriophage resistance protein